MSWITNGEQHGVTSGNTDDRISQSLSCVVNLRNLKLPGHLILQIEIIVRPKDAASSILSLQESKLLDGGVN